MATEPDEAYFDANSEPVARRIAVALSKLGLAMRSQAWQGAGPRGLTPTQAQILVALAARPGGLRLGAIASELGVTPPTVTDSVAALVAKGLVEKRRAPDDARATVATLTTGGRREASQLSGWPDFLVTAVESLTAPEQEALLASLIALIRALQAQGHIAEARMCISCRHFAPHRHAEPARPHHCTLVDAPLSAAHLRLDCPEHLAADEDVSRRVWARLRGVAPDA
jgi:DNA-binding MarR family transcriptional regulator